MVNFFTFSGHSDTEQLTPVKKSDLWLSLSQQGGGSLFDLGQLSMTSIWLNQNMAPPPSWLKLCQISNFLAVVHFSTSKWPEKIEFDLQAFTRIQNHPIESDMMRKLSVKGHFWKWFLVIWILDYSKVSNKGTFMLTHFEVFEPPWWHFNHCPGYLTLYWQFWSLERNCMSKNDFFWSFWHSTT